MKLDIRPAVFDYETAEKISQEAQKAGKVQPIHLAFDTGMTRIGFRHPKESLPEILRISQTSGNYDRRLRFTHFARADEQGSDLCPSAIRKLSGISDFAGRSRYSDSDPVTVTTVQESSGTVGVISMPYVRELHFMVSHRLTKSLIRA